jgi:hypothetical protein
MPQQTFSISEEHYRAKISSWSWCGLGLASTPFAVLGLALNWAPWVTAVSYLASGAIGYFVGQYAVSETFHCEKKCKECRK